MPGGKFAEMKLFAWLGRYMGHPCPRAATANRIAMIVGWNTPFYPLYLAAMPGHGIFPAGWLTLCSAPFFLAVPAIMRRHPLAGRVLLPVFGLANSVFCTWLLGARSGTDLFLFPCAVLPILLHGSGERIAQWALLGAALLAFWVCGEAWMPSLTSLAPATLDALFRLNSLSAICLLAFMALTASPLLLRR
jgi:hypothetical protein